MKRFERSNGLDTALYKNYLCLHVITGQDYRDTATTPVYDLVLAVRQRRMRYLGHVLRMPPDRIVRRALVALVKGDF